MNQKTYLTEDLEHKQKDMRLLKMSWDLLKSRQLLIVLVLLLMLCAEILPLFFPYLTKELIDGPIKENFESIDAAHKEVLITQISRGAMLIFGLMVAVGLLSYFKAMLMQYIGQSVVYDLRKKIITHVLHLHLDFFKRTPVGRLMNRITYDMDTLSSLFTDGLTELIGSSLMIIFALIFMFHINVTLTLISLAFVPFLILSTWAFSVKMRVISRSVTGEMSKMTSAVQESIGGMSLIQMFGKQNENQENFSKINLNFRNQYIRYAQYFALFMPSLVFIIEFAIVTVVGYGAWHILNGGTEITIGDIAIFPWYLLLLFNPFRELSDKYTQLQRSFSAGERIFHLLNVKTDIKDGEISNISHPATIEIKNITFAYNIGENILKNISLTINPGQNIAIVGATGSGKTTLVSLLKKHYIVQEGAILINNVDIKNIQNKTLHKLITFVPQDIFVFSDTIAHNIALSDEIDYERIKAVCEVSNANKFIEKLPQKYDSLLNERGTILSTGQRQLLAFARALYQKPEILILDEATSNIDTESELLIQDAVKKMMKHTTMVVIAHRLSTIQHSDQILVMHHGQIVEKGTHDQLLKLKGLYNKLCQMQFHLHTDESNK